MPREMGFAYNTLLAAIAFRGVSWNPQVPMSAQMVLIRDGLT